MKNTNHISFEIDNLTELVEDYYLLQEAEKRMKNNKGKKILSEQEVMDILGISENDIISAEDLEIE